MEAICRKYIELRYRLLPAIYTLFWQYAAQGMPMMRPLFFEDPTDERLRAIDDQWLFGDHLLVAPALEAGMHAREVVIPAGTWYDFWSDEPVEGPCIISCETPLDSVPLFVRAGAVLPMGPVQQFVGEKPDAPLELHLFPGTAVSWLYEDDGESLAYQQGAFRLTRFEMHFDGAELVLRREVSGTWRPPRRPITIIFHTDTTHQVLFDDSPHFVLNNQVQLADDTWQVLRATIA